MSERTKWSISSEECARAFCEEARKLDSLIKVAKALSKRFFHPTNKAGEVNAQTLTKALDSSQFSRLVRDMAADADILLGKFRAPSSSKARPQPSLRKIGE